MLRSLLSSLLVVCSIAGTAGIGIARPTSRTPGKLSLGTRPLATSASCVGVGSLANSINEVNTLDLVNAAHPSETNPVLKAEGNTVLKVLYADTPTQNYDAALPSTGIPAGVLSRTYPYAITNGASLASTQSYVSYAFKYQSYATLPSYPAATRGPNGEPTVYQWGPGSFETPNDNPLSPVGSGTMFLADLGHALLLLENIGGASAPTSSSSFYQQTYLGKTYLQHAEDALHWLIQPSEVKEAMSDTPATNRIFRYAAAYALLGKALANVGDVTDGCTAIKDSATFLQSGLNQGATCLSSIYETFPESPNRYAPSCAMFDSSYQNVSLQYLVWLYQNMPSAGIPTASGTEISTSQVFAAVIQGMNKESTTIDYTSSGVQHVPASGWCYASGAFGDGEISECGNSRITGASCSSPSYDAITATSVLQEYGQLYEAASGGQTVWISIADQVGNWYNSGTSCTGHPYQPYYL